ncbi:MAG: phosphoadenylyl-sulfate reductase [Abditibacteriales bacterium]|nr:phosphoadenylyl-sulfate reductase [Abditibacteriales bacterium]
MTSFSPQQIESISLSFERAEPLEILRWAWETFGTRAAFGTSFQGAGLVAMDIAYRHGLRFPLFTIDTGLLFPETLELKRKIEERLGVEIESLTPELTVEQQAEVYGAELWKRDPDHCCYMRKVEPLQKKLAHLDAWITGLRREQSETRQSIGIVELYEFDEATGKNIVKINPMSNWSRAQVWDYIKQNNLPYHPLHDLGYRSIGCVPCTRPVGEGDSERAGRWTGFNKTECGLHTFMKKREVLGRTNTVNGSR